MSIQFTATLISFVGIALLLCAFMYVIARSREQAPYSEVQPPAQRLRKQLFLVLLVGFFAVPALTLRSTPYSAAARTSDPIVVDVSAHQWSWRMSANVVLANRSVVFRVRSEDVNHGFGIYDEDNRLLAQVQAMPGYVNELAIEFDRPGTYKVMCLEYCGLAHHGMVSAIQVVAATSDARVTP